MLEIEKLYENAGIEPEYQDCCKLADKYWDNKNLAGEYVCFDHYMKAVCPHNQECTDECKNAYDKTIYPEFTAEKQLELIKWLLTKVIDTEHIHLEFSDRTFKFLIHSVACSGDDCDTLENALCSYINNLWQDLSDTEKAEIKEILK